MCQAEGGLSSALIVSGNGAEACGIHSRRKSCPATLAPGRRKGHTVYEFGKIFSFNPARRGRRYAKGGTIMPVNEPQKDQMRRILLAEDDEDMRRFLVKALKNAGFDVVDFGNGVEAYERLKEEPFTLLLTDIVMPEMDGIELARRAAELDPDLKIMFITGFAAVALNPDNEAPKEAKVLSKPFHLRDLVQEVERMLAA
jgi:two-component system, cell cycle response regulator CpdR